MAVRRIKNQIYSGAWSVLISQIIEDAAGKGNGCLREKGTGRIFLRKEIAFPECGLEMRENSVCQFLLWEEGMEQADSWILSESMLLEDTRRERPEIHDFYYCVNLDQRDERQREYLDHLKEGIGNYMESGQQAFFWDISIIEQILNQKKDIVAGYASYLKDAGDREQLFTDGQNKTMNVMERYLEKCFMEDQISRMEQAGSVTNEKIALQKVFVDLEVFPENSRPDLDEGAMLFVERMIRRGNEVNRYRDSGDGEDKAENEYERNGYVLLGTAGQGKSTVCQYLMQIYRATYLNQAGRGRTRREVAAFLEEYAKGSGREVRCSRIPIHIVMKEYAAWIQRRVEQEEAADVFFYIMEQIRRKTTIDPDPEIVRELFGRMSWIFVFDGLDEVPSSSNRERLIGEIREFFGGELLRWECDYLVVCTSRPQGDLEGLSRRAFYYLRLSELSQERCMVYLTRLVDQMCTSADEKKEALEVLRDSLRDPIVSRLMKSPLQATIVAILVKTGGKPPRDRYNLFQTYYETIKNREKQKETLETLHDTFDWMDRIQSRLALRLQRESESDKNPSALITRPHFLGIIRDYLEEVEDEREAADRERRCRSFFHILTERLCFITDVNKEGEYMFSIRSMQEFLAASGIVSQRESQMLEELNRIAPSIYWRNVFLFAIGYLNKNVPELEEEVRKICERLNGSECTPARYNMEKVSLAGSRLALDILLEGIYKGASKVEKSYCDLFFQMKDRAVTGCLKECARLPREKREYLKTEYVLPEMKSEPGNLTLWYLLTILERPEQVLELLKNTRMEPEEKKRVFEFLADEIPLWQEHMEAHTVELAAELLEICNRPLDLSYEECCQALRYAGLKDMPTARRRLYELLLLKGGEADRQSEVRRSILSGLPSFWNDLETLLDRLKKAKKDYEVAEAITFHLKYIAPDDQEREVLEHASAWCLTEGLSVEAAFLDMLQNPDMEHRSAYLTELWKEDTYARINWLNVHREQSHVVFGLDHTYNVDRIAELPLEAVLKCVDLDYETEYQEACRAMEGKDWSAFWKNADAMSANGSSSNQGILRYLQETGRELEDIPDMQEKELAYLLFVSALNVEARELGEEEEAVLKAVYRAYTGQEWKDCWVNIWARRIAMHLLNEKKSEELIGDRDDYQAFIPTEKSPYFFTKRGVTGKEMKNLWDGIIWMAEAVDQNRAVFRVVPAILLASPRLETELPAGRFRQLLEDGSDDELKELGRLLYLMLVPDWTEEEAQKLSSQVQTYLHGDLLYRCRIFLEFGKRYAGKRTSADQVWLDMYGALITSEEGRTGTGRCCLEQLGELAYQKVTGAETV